MGHCGLMVAEDGVLSSGYQSPVYRESSASYPPLSTMQQQFNPNTLMTQLQALQMQLQLQPSNGQASQPQQPRISGLGSVPSVNRTSMCGSGLTPGGTLPAHVLLVLSEPSLGALFRQALSQAPVPSVLYLASTHELWAVVDQLKKTIGRPSGPDIVFFQPEVLMANPGTVVRLKQICGAGCTAVVLQGSEPIARALQADDFLAGPTPSQPLRKEDVALMILKWRNRQLVSASSSTLSSVPSAGGISLSSALSAPTASGDVAISAVSATGISTMSSGGGVAPVLPSGASSPKSVQISQLQALQAQLQALQQAKQEQKARSSAVNMASQRNSCEIEPVGSAGPVQTLSVAAAAATPRISPSRRPPPLRLASAGVAPTDAYPDVERNLTRASMPVGIGSTSVGSATEVSELVAQVAELRRKLGDKSRAVPVRSPTGSGAGGGTSLSPTALSPTASLSGNFLNSGIISGGPSGALNSGGSGLGGGALALSPFAPSADLQLQLQSLQAKQQALLQKMAIAGGRSSGGGAQQVTAGSSSVGGAMAAGLGASSGTAAGSINPNKRPSGRASLQGFVSLSRPVGDAAVPPSPPPLTTPPPPSQFASVQLQQQLVQLQQLQFQLQQQPRLPLAAPNGPITAVTPALALEARLLNTSPTSSLTSNLGSPLPGPGSVTGALQPNVSNTGSDSSTVSRSNSFVAAGGTRYRPPRQRLPSPLSSVSGAASGHISDTYPGLSTSRFASPQFRSGSGSGGGPGGPAVGGAGRRSAGNGSGHTSDSGTSPDLGPSVRDTMRSGSSAPANKSGDDAIAAALNAVSGRADADADSPAGSPASAPASGTAGAGGSSILTDALRNSEGAADGGSSTDGRSLMDASFALDDSGGGGRGSISGGAASSIDFQPSPSGQATPPLQPPPSASSEEQPLPELHPRSNQGGTRLGSHRLSSSAIITEAPEDDDQPLRVRAVRQPAQGLGASAPASATAVTTGDSSGSNLTSKEAPPSKEGLLAPTTNAPKTAAAAGQPGKASDVAERSTQDQPSPSEPLGAPDKVSIPRPGYGCGESSHLDGFPAATVALRGTVVHEDDSVCVASPDSSASQLQIRPSLQQQSLPSIKGSAKVAANSSSGGGGTAGPQLPATPASKLARTDSQCDDRLPSIDGTQPITAAISRGSCSRGSNTATAAVATVSSSSPHRQASTRSADSDARRGPVVSSSSKAAGVVSDSPSTNASNGVTMESQNQTPIDNGVPVSRLPAYQSNDGGSLVASIEGSITAGLPHAGSRGPSGASHVGMGEPQLQSSASRGRSGASGGYTDDIFSTLQSHERREVFSPALVTGPPSQQVQLQPPPRPATPPARRAARILLSSHPIVITREDFLPF